MMLIKIKRGGAIRHTTEDKHNKYFKGLGYHVVWQPKEPEQVEEVPQEAPEVSTDHKVDWEQQTKQEISEELGRRGIEFNKRDAKTELIQLLEGDQDA